MKWWRTIRIVIGTLLNQDFPLIMPTSSSWRILLGAWLVFALVISTGYKSNLTAFLTLPQYLPRPETLEELVDTGAK